MKNVFYLMALVFLASCASKEEKKVESTIYIEKQLADFINANPDWVKDEATEKETTEKFQRKLINLSNEVSFLDDMPLQLNEIKDTVYNEIRTKIGKFKNYGDTTRAKSSLLNFMQLEVIGLVSPEQADSLVVGKHYTLKGTLYKQGKRGDVKFIHVADFKGYDLGKYTFDITNIKPL